MSRLTRDAFQKLVDENLAWLRAQPRTLERDHVVMIVEKSVELIYGPLGTEKEDRIERKARAGCNRWCLDWGAPGLTFDGYNERMKTTWREVARAMAEVE